MKKLLIIQYYTPNLEYGKYSEELNRRYCDKFGIDYFCLTDKSYIDSKVDNRPYMWYKILFLIEKLKEKEYEYVMFLDADAIFVKEDYNIVDLLEHHKEYDLIINRDFGPDVVNTGSMIFKNTEWSIDFLERVWDKANIISRGRYKSEIWHEQTIMSIFLTINEKDIEKTKILHPDTLNSINDLIYVEGQTLIYHDLSKIRIPEFVKIAKGTFDVYTELNISTTSDREVSHRYASYYVKLIEKLLLNKGSIRVLDIGGDNGVTFDIITRYFRNVYYDNLTNRDYENSNENINKIIFNSLEKEEISAIAENLNDIEYDLIISDFGHQCSTRDLFFSLFFDKLKSKGIYVIEDIQTDAEIEIPEKNAMYGWGDINKKSMTQLINRFNSDGTFDSDYEDFKDSNIRIEKAMIVNTTSYSQLGLLYKK